MTLEMQNRLNGDGNPEDIPESDEQLTTVFKTLQQLKGQDGQLVSLGKQELGLLQTVFRSVSEEYREIQFFRMVNFLDDDEALDHVAAFYEAKELGMDTAFNVAFMFAKCSVNNRNRRNLIEIISDTMQFGKHASVSGGKKSSGSDNPRSPLAG